MSVLLRLPIVLLLLAWSGLGLLAGLNAVRNDLWRTRLVDDVVTSTTAVPGEPGVFLGPLARDRFGRRENDQVPVFISGELTAQVPLAGNCAAVHEYFFHKAREQRRGLRRILHLLEGDLLMSPDWTETGHRLRVASGVKIQGWLLNPRFFNSRSLDYIEQRQPCSAAHKAQSMVRGSGDNCVMVSQCFPIGRVTLLGWKLAHEEGGKGSIDILGENTARGATIMPGTLTKAEFIAAFQERQIRLLVSWKKLFILQLVAGLLALIIAQNNIWAIFNPFGLVRRVLGTVHGPITLLLMLAALGLQFLSYVLLARGVTSEAVLDLAGLCSCICFAAACMFMQITLMQTR